MANFQTKWTNAGSNNDSELHGDQNPDHYYVQPPPYSATTGFQPPTTMVSAEEVGLFVGVATTIATRSLQFAHTVKHR